jgi:hypothetical protein
MDEKIFRKTSLEQISSPEQLYNYIKVANPGVWMVLGAILLAIAALVFWGVSATIPTTISTVAMAEGDGRYVCYISPSLGTGIRPGMGVRINGTPGTVTKQGEIPLSYREAAQFLPSDYAAYALGLGDWNIKVDIAAEEGNSAEAPKAGSLVQAVITIAQTRPLDFLFN